MQNGHGQVRLYADGSGRNGQQHTNGNREQDSVALSTTQQNSAGLSSKPGAIEDFELAPASVIGVPPGSNDIGSPQAASSYCTARGANHAVHAGGPTPSLVNLARQPSAVSVLSLPSSANTPEQQSALDVSPPAGSATVAASAVHGAPLTDVAPSLYPATISQARGDTRTPLVRPWQETPTSETSASAARASPRRRDVAPGTAGVTPRRGASSPASSARSRPTCASPSIGSPTSLPSRAASAASRAGAAHDVAAASPASARTVSELGVESPLEDRHLDSESDCNDASSHQVSQSQVTLTNRHLISFVQGQ